MALRSKEYEGYRSDRVQTGGHSLPLAFRAERGARTLDRSLALWSKNSHKATVLLPRGCSHVIDAARNSPSSTGSRPSHQRFRYLHSRRRREPQTHTLSGRRLNCVSPGLASASPAGFTRGNATRSRPRGPTVTAGRAAAWPPTGSQTGVQAPARNSGRQSVG